MPFENIDKSNEPQTDEFEKLEFLPEEQALDDAPLDLDTTEIVFDPDLEGPEEPPVSFDRDSVAEFREAPEFGSPTPPASGLDLEEVDTPFELFGTSLFGETELDTDEMGLFEIDEDLEF